MTERLWLLNGAEMMTRTGPSGADSYSVRGSTGCARQWTVTMESRMDVEDV